jgi:ribose transport system permease protein
MYERADLSLLHVGPLDQQEGWRRLMEGGSRAKAARLVPTGRWGARASRSEQAIRIGLAAVRVGPLLILILLAAVMTALDPIFLTQRNVTNVFVQSSVIATLALGQLLVILTRGIDLSVGSAMALATVTGALVYHSSAGSPVLALLTMIGTGVAIGVINGVLLVKGRLPHPFIVTLAMLSAASGLALVISDGRAIPDMPTAIRDAGSGFVGPFPIPALIVLGLALLASVLTRRLKWGRWIYAVGGNPEAARRTGIPVNRVLISVYVLSGLAAGVAAIIVAGRTNAGFPTAGRLAELDAIAAVIIGGASFFGGRGTVGNAIVGALTIGVIRNGLNLLGVDAAWQLVAVGVVVVIAVELDVVRSHLERRFRVLQATFVP